MNTFVKTTALTIYILAAWANAVFAADEKAKAPLPSPQAQGTVPADQGGTPENYIIQPLDELYFAIYDEPETEGLIHVSADGTADFLFLGSVPLAGKTMLEARQFLYVEYNRDYYVEPQIKLLIKNYSERRLQIIGQVNRPGFVLMPPEEKMSVVEAIAGAGGFTRLANSSKVTLKRIMPDGSTKIIKVNVDQITENPQKEDIPLQKGDTLIVPERTF